jgi:hypothetical protein
LQQPRPDYPSIIHYSLSKAATQYVKQVLKRLTAPAGYIPLHYSEMAWATNRIPYFDLLSAQEMQAYQHVFQPRGFLYSAYGGFIEGIDQLDQYRIVLVVRDPRDILVSHYYSFENHAIPPRLSHSYEHFERERARRASMTIDDFVVHKIDFVRKALVRYKEGLLQQHPHVLVLYYEDMIRDFEGWLGQIVNYLDCSPPQAVIDSIVEETYASRRQKAQEGENISNHYRKGQPGDYKEKLKPETIATLNARMADELAAFGYPLD